MIDMHLFDENEVDEKALCGAHPPADYRRSVKYYLDDRLRGAPVGSICPECKARVVCFARRRGSDLEADGLTDEAEEYRDLAYTLARETGQNTPN